MYSLALTKGAGLRITRDDQDAAAIADLDAALRELGVPFDHSPDGEVTIRVGRRGVPVELSSMAVASASSVGALIADAASKPLQFLVADRISRDARARLDAAGWGWLDRRGELALRVGDNYLVRSRVATRRSPASERALGPIRSRAGIAYLAAALERPDETPVLRAVARRAGLSHVALSNARASLRDVGLVDERGRALDRVSFEALAESWTTEVVAVKEIPQPTTAAILGLHDDAPEQPGWALTDTLGAIAWGARIAVTADYPPDFVLPSRRDADRARRVLGQADEYANRGATIEVAPVRFATDRRYDVPGTQWLVTHPLYIALAIARDRSRGPEILAAWDPSGPEGFHRSW
jgi:hypothetical protein